MSGEGLLAAAPPMDASPSTIWDVARERGDVLALLDRRRANALRIAGANPTEADRARIIARECEIVADMIEHGLHEGESL